MTPGPTLDSLIARRLWRAIVLVENGRYQFVEQGTHIRVPLPAYSTDLDEAQRIVRVLQSRGLTARVGHDPALDQYRAAFTIDNLPCVWRYSLAKTLPHAICLAALSALDGSNVENP